MDTKEFVKTMISDEALAQRMAACTSPDEAYGVAKEAGLTDTQEQFVAEMEKFNRKVSEVSEDDLESLNAAGAKTVVVDISASATIVAAVSSAFSI